MTMGSRMSANKNKITDDIATIAAESASVSTPIEKDSTDITVNETSNEPDDNDIDENYPTTIVIAALEEWLKTKLHKEESQQHCRYTVEKATAKGDNYLGIVYRINVKSESTLRSLILKVPPQNAARRKQFFARPCFLRESMAYDEFLLLVAQYQEERGIEPSERFVHYAKCYRTITTEMHEAIFLEDLCTSGFKLFNRFGTLQRKHVNAVMRAYGKLHAVSFALKQQELNRLRPFQQIVDIFKQRENDPGLAAYFEKLKVDALDALDDNKTDGIYIERLKAYFESGTIMKLLLEALDSHNCEPYAVVCHGDCWNNNIMYRYDDEDGETPVEARLIDWQLMRYASPVTDLGYYFFTCTTKQFRDAHYADMLDVYYAELSQQLLRFGTDVDEVFPRSAFEAQLHQKAAVGLLLAMMVLPIVTMSGSDVPDLEVLSEMVNAGKSVDLKGCGFLSANNEHAYKQRIRGVIIDCIDHNYI